MAANCFRHTVQIDLERVEKIERFDVAIERDIAGRVPLDANSARLKDFAAG